VNSKYLCSNCYKSYPNKYNKWCKECHAKQFQQNISNWSSRNEFIDKFIQKTQLNVKSNDKISEWIPYNRFENIKCLNNTKYEAIWLDGPIEKYSFKEKKWIRCNKKENNNNIKEWKVVFKSLNKSLDLNEEFLNKV